ncbi:MAG: hypothetical protein JWQ04_667 [Pedosphaera sp.]|nr:hypothetical protein [Pedosphaera sp.]
MKTRIFSITSGTLGLAVIGLLLVAGRMQGRQSSATVDDSTALAGDTAATNAAPAEPTELPPAPPAVAAATQPLPVNPQTPPAGVKLSQGATDIARFAQSGIGPEVMLAYIANENSKFNLGSDQIVYLNDLGVDGTVVKAMIQRDAAIDATAQAAAASLAVQNMPPVNPYPPAQPAQPDDASYPSAPPMEDSTAQMPPYDPGTYVPSDDAEYFYSSLAPYGNWTYVAGAGLCWQPTVYRGNHDWRPYGDRGRWLYSDCGWYWQSDYSWGWAPFHYGRWFEDAHHGWVWSPDRVWGPAWVSWRQSGEYCGWAPLPPSARFVPGSGFRYANHPVGEGFEFGLKAHHYTFIPIARMSDYAPNRYASARWQADEICNQTKVITHVTEQNHRVVNAGVDPKLVAAGAGTEIRRAEIRELPNNGNGGRTVMTDRLTKSDGNMVIYHPGLPAPTRHPLGGAGVAPGSRPAQMPAGRNYGAPKTSLNNPSAPAPVHLATTVNAAAQSPYPPGSLIVHGNGQASHSPAPAPAPLPNMNLSYLAHQNTTASQSVQPAPQQQMNSYYDSTGQRTGWQQSETPRSYAGYSVVNGFARPNNPETFTPRSAPAQIQSSYVNSGRFTAAQHLGASAPQSYSTSGDQLSAHAQQTMEGASHVIAAHYTASEQLNGPTRNYTASAPSVNANAHSERIAEAASQSHFESHAPAYSAPAPAPAAHVSSPAPSSSSSSGKK